MSGYHMRSAAAQRGLRTAARKAVAEGQALASVAAALGVSEAMVAFWVNNPQEDGRRLRLTAKPFSSARR